MTGVRCSMPLMTSNPYADGQCKRRGAYIGSDGAYYCGQHSRLLAKRDLERRTAARSAPPPDAAQVRVLEARYCQQRAKRDELAEQLFVLRRKHDEIEAAVTRMHRELEELGINPVALFDAVSS